MVRAKFQCNGVSPVKTNSGDDSFGYNINFNAVYNDSNGQQNEENKKYWKMTPAGNISMYTVNENAAKEFKQGKYYYIDFTEVE
jgi:hypothetical protein